MKTKSNFLAIRTIFNPAEKKYFLQKKSSRKLFTDRILEDLWVAVCNLFYYSSRNLWKLLRGHSVRITAYLLTPLMFVCIHFIREWRHDRNFWETFSWHVYLSPGFLLGIWWEKIAKEIFFFIFRFDGWPGIQTRTLRPIRYLLDYGDYLRCTIICIEFEGNRCTTSHLLNHFIFSINA